MRKWFPWKWAVVAAWEQWSGDADSTWFFPTWDEAVAFVALSEALNTGSTYTVVEAQS
jgi:hypothetical protein